MCMVARSDLEISTKVGNIDFSKRIFCLLLDSSRFSIPNLLCFLVESNFLLQRYHHISFHFSLFTYQPQCLMYRYLQARMTLHAEPRYFHSGGTSPI